MNWYDQCSCLLNVSLDLIAFIHILFNLHLPHLSTKLEVERSTPLTHSDGGVEENTFYK